MKKKFFYAVACIFSMAISSCQYDDAEVWDAINNQEERIANLEEWQKTTNDNIAALQAIVNGSNDYITSVEELKEGDEIVGYTINFHRQGEVTIYNGKDGEKGDQGEKGEDALAPVIGVIEGEDGRWYWTVNGEIMKDANGNPVYASGKDGEDGETPSVVTPMVKLGSELGYEYHPYASYLSVDNGETWTQLTIPMGWQNNSLESINDYGDYYSFRFYSAQDGYYSTLNIPKYGIKLSFYFYSMDASQYNGYGISNGKYKVPEGMPFKIMVRSNDGEWTYEVENGTEWNFSREGDNLVCPSAPNSTAVLKFTHYSKNNEVTFFQIRLTTYAMKALYRSDNPSLFDALVLYYGNNIVAEDGSIKAIPYLANEQNLYLEYRNITSLEGLEIFESLENLYCSNNQLTELDLSNLPNIKELYCNYNQLTELNVSNNPALERISCMGNQLKDLDVSNNKNLNYLEVDNNMIESLDISQNTALETLWIPNNKLTDLDVSSNVNLMSLYCQGNLLKTLDVSDNVNLYNLVCGAQMDAEGNNQILILTIGDNQMQRWETVWQYNNTDVSLAQ